MEKMTDTQFFQTTSNEIMQTTQNSNPRKLTGVDVFVLVILSAILSLLSFFLAEGYFYDIERGNSFVGTIDSLILLPFTLITYFLILLLGEGVAFLLGLAATLFMPTFSFIFWFSIFYFLARISKKFLTSRDTLFFRHVSSIIIVIILSTPHFVYSVGSNKIDACLSGRLNSVMTSGNSSIFIGPDDCFDRILSPMVQTENPSSKETINFCMGLSTDKTVPGTESSYRDYCIYALGLKLYPNNNFTFVFHQQYMSQLPPPTFNKLSWEKTVEWEANYRTRLCEVYGLLTDSDDVKNKCLVHYIDIRNPYGGETQIYCKNLKTNHALPERCSGALSPAEVFSSARNDVAGGNATLLGSIADGSYNIPNLNLVIKEMLYISAQASTPNQIQIDKDISDENYPLQGESHVNPAPATILKLMSFNKEVSANDAVREATRLGYRSATIREILPFAWNFYNSRWSITIISYDPSSNSKRIPLLQRISGVAKIKLAPEPEYTLRRGEWLLVSKINQL